MALPTPPDSKVTKGVGRIATLPDFERNLDALLEREITETLGVRSRIQTDFIKAGGLAASRYPVTVEAQVRPKFRAALTAAIKLLHSFRSTTALTYEELQGPAQNRLENFVQRTVTLIAETNKSMPTLNLAALEEKYYDDLKNAFKDYEIGFIAGEPLSSLTVTKSALLDSGEVSATIDLGELGDTPTTQDGRGRQTSDGDERVTSSGALRATAPSVVLGTASIPRSPISQSQRSEILDRLVTIERLLNEFKPLIQDASPTSRERGLIGDNNPPEPIELLDEERVAEGISIINVYRTEISANSPRIDVMELCGIALKGIHAAIKATTRYFAEKADKFVDEAVVSAGKAVGPVIAAAAILTVLKSLDVNVSETISMLGEVLQLLK